MTSRPNGAGGVAYDAWRITADKDCTLYGVPKVTLYDTSGTPRFIQQRGYSGWFGYPKTRPQPTEVGPGRTVIVQIAKYRCDTAQNPPRLTSARLTMPLGPRPSSEAGALRGKLALPLEYCPHDDGNQDLHVTPIGYVYGAKPKPYAVNLDSTFDPEDHPTWGSADVDGDGQPDTVILDTKAVKRGIRNQVWLTVHLATGRSARAEVERDDEPIRLQALSDLNGDGRAEILVGYPSDPAGPGYYNGVTDSVLFIFAGGRLRKAVAARPFMLSFSERGDQAAAVVCHGDEFTQVSVNIDYQPARIVSSTYRLDGFTPVLVGRTVTTSSQNPFDLLSTTRSECPGMGADGWAAGD